MKKAFIAIALIIAAVASIFLVLVPHSDTEHIMTSIPRAFGSFQLTATDTIRFPGYVSQMNISDGKVYAFDQTRGALFRYDPASRRLDTFLHTRPYFSEIPTSIDVDAASACFFLANRKMIYIFKAGQQADSMDVHAHPFLKACRYQTEQHFLIQHYDTATGVVHLEKIDYHQPEQAQKLFSFPRFDDRGIMADGGFSRNASTGKYYFTPLHNAGIIELDPATHTTSTITTIDKTPPRNTVVRVGKAYSISSKSAFINLSAAADGHYLYVLSAALSKDSETGGPVLDVYRLPGGAYAGSMRVPPYEKKGLLHIDAADHTLYISHENDILIYNIRTP